MYWTFPILSWKIYNDQFVIERIAIDENKYIITVKLNGLLLNTYFSEVLRYPFLIVVLNSKFRYLFISKENYLIGTKGPKTTNSNILIGLKLYFKTLFGN